jgi:hypothetical protein
MPCLIFFAQLWRMCNFKCRVELSPESTSHVKLFPLASNGLHGNSNIREYPAMGWRKLKPGSLARENSFAFAIFAEFAEAGKRRNKAVHLLEKRVISMIRTAAPCIWLANHNDWSRWLAISTPPTDAGLAQGNSFAPACLHNLLRLAIWGSKAVLLLEKSVISMIPLPIDVTDSAIIMIGPGGLLLVVSRQFAVYGWASKKLNN